MKCDVEIRAAVPYDLEGIEALLPRLADFPVPQHRAPEQLWHGDRELVRTWAKGTANGVRVSVANHEQELVGVVVVSARKELLSGEPSAHIEILAVKNGAEGQGIGSALMLEAHQLAAVLGAKGISLHVFANNARARSLYEKQGFSGEILRYYKPL